jgi:rubrerythrin
MPLTYATPTDYDAQQAERTAISRAAALLLDALADDDAEQEALTRTLVRHGLMYRCSGCGYAYPIDGSDDFCERRYPDCAACDDGEPHPHTPARPRKR